VKVTEGWIQSAAEEIAKRHSPHTHSIGASVDEIITKHAPAPDVRDAELASMRSAVKALRAERDDLKKRLVDLLNEFKEWVKNGAIAEQTLKYHLPLTATQQKTAVGCVSNDETKKLRETLESIAKFCEDTKRDGVYFDDAFVAKLARTALESRP
jgi:hypothetical protein